MTRADRGQREQKIELTEESKTRPKEEPGVAREPAIIRGRDGQGEQTLIAVLR